MCAILVVVLLLDYRPSPYFALEPHLELAAYLPMTL